MFLLTLHNKVLGVNSRGLALMFLEGTRITLIHGWTRIGACHGAAWNETPLS
jgi:hypothetical protein